MPGTLTWPFSVMGQAC
ncbi:hypothetical protein E2C01_079738 [Portunus trituberculatus]|uniref:Uncharacterized protein n=1 Tax=Portunus trituberculatus TaxID=210409 RepID=A0A5B7IHN3_PORTR|nr:hypothetical protein [Portunus trituberculatus]